MLEKFFATRHSIKPKGEDRPSAEYEGISEKGEELAKKERAAEILANLQEAAPGTVMFLGGASDLVRTKSTAEAYGTGVKELIAEQGIIDVAVYDQNDLPTEGQTKKVEWLVQQIQENPDKKFLLDMPLFLNEFAANTGTGWFEKNGQPTPYCNELMKQTGGDQQASVEAWLDNQGQLGDLVGPNPKEVAERQLQGLERLHDFASKYLPDNEIVVGAVGHSFDLDALAAYLANNGQANLEGYQKAGGQMIKETQMIKVFTEGEEQYLQYGDQRFAIGDQIEAE